MLKAPEPAENLLSNCDSTAYILFSNGNSEMIYQVKGFFVIELIDMKNFLKFKFLCESCVGSPITNAHLPVPMTI